MASRGRSLLTIDYGHGVRRCFSRVQLDQLHERLGIGTSIRAIREATRTWAESIPSDMKECFTGLYE